MISDDDDIEFDYENDQDQVSDEKNYPNQSNNQTSKKAFYNVIPSNKSHNFIQNIST